MGEIRFTPDKSAIKFTPDPPASIGPELLVAQPNIGITTGPENPKSRIGQGIDSFISKRLNQLSGEEPGILNPDPNKNTILNRSWLPANQRYEHPELFPTDDRSLIGKGTDWAYENLIRPLASPLGVYGTILDANPADMSLAKTGAFSKPTVEPKLKASMIAGPIEQKLGAKLATIDFANPDLHPLMKLAEQTEFKTIKSTTEKLKGVPKTMERFGVTPKEEMPYPYNVVPNKLRPTQDFFSELSWNP